MLVIDHSTLDKAEAYGDCLTHASGHYERWEGIEAQTVVIRSDAHYLDSNFLPDWITILSPSPQLNAGVQYE